MGVTVLVALLALGFCASMARAEPLSMDFTEARADVGVQLSISNDDDALFKAPATAPFEAQIDPWSGLITAGELEVPQFSTHIDDPIDADVTVDFEIGTITGSFNQAVGALSLSGTAGGTLAADGEQCTVSVPGFLTVTTGGSSGGADPRSGAPFTAGLTGAGALAGTWDDMLAEPVDEDDANNVWFCEHVYEEIGGPGGIWLEHDGDVVPPSAPQLTSTDPASPPACVVPKLVGKTLARAKTALKAAGCKLGKVTKPKRAKGKKRRVLVIKSSSPRRGAKPADGKVDLKLHPKPKPKPKKTRR
jgi:hypothetical protein